MPAPQAEKATPLAMIRWSDRGLQMSSFDEAYRLAKCIHTSNLAPKSFDTPEKIFVVIESGAELGLPPMQALSCMCVINGRPSLYGDALPGLIKGHGKLEWRKEYYTGKPFDDDYTAHADYKRVGDPEIYSAEFSVEDAKRAKLWGKVGRSGEPTPWVTYPKRMLMMRARGFCIRDGFADILCGFGVAEEQLDIPSYEEPAIRRAIEQANDANYCALVSTLTGKCHCIQPPDNPTDEFDFVVGKMTRDFGKLAEIQGNEQACGDMLKAMEGRHEEIAKEVEQRRRSAAA